MTALEERPHRKDAGNPNRLPLLVGLLVLVGVAYAATAPLRRQLEIRTELTRREIAAAEKQAEDRAGSTLKRQERAELIARLADNPNDAPLLLKVGALFSQDRGYEDAVFYFHEARRLMPDSSEPYRALVQTYISDAQYDRAYDCVSEGLRRHSKDLELVLALVHLDTLIGWNLHARSELKRLSGTPDDGTPRVLIARALVHRQVADSRHAEQDLQAALSKDPNNSKIYALLSGVQFETGRAGPAEESILRAIELEPENAEYLIHLAMIQRGKRTPESIEASRVTAERALRADPGNQHAFFAIAQALLDQKKILEAQKILEQLLKRYPDHGHAALELGRIYVRQGRPREGKPLLEDYDRRIQVQDELKGLTVKVNMERGNPEAHLQLGKFFLQKGSPEKAILAFRWALQLRPSSRAAREGLGEALTAVGRQGEYGELSRFPEWHLLDIMDPQPARPPTAHPTL